MKWLLIGLFIGLLLGLIIGTPGINVMDVVGNPARITEVIPGMDTG